MPKLEPKAVQKELDQELLWPVYWLFGGERMKARELLKRIKRAALGEAAHAHGLGGFAEEVLDATEADAASVLDAARSLALGGGPRLVVVREAHALKEAEILEPLLGPRAKAESLTSVCVFLSKDLDGRKKFSKILLERAAVVPCEEVPESEREAWIQYLAKRRGVNLPAGLIPRLSSLDPWSLDIIDQELEKYSLYGASGQSPDATAETVDVILDGAAGGGGGEAFLNAFFMREFDRATRAVETFADQPDESLPLLGLLAWNVRHLALGGAKLNPYLAERIRAWGRHWSLAEIKELQEALEELDFSIKQKPLLPLGLWGSLVIRFCSRDAGQ